MHILHIMHIMHRRNTQGAGRIRGQKKEDPPHLLTRARGGAQLGPPLRSVRADFPPTPRGPLAPLPFFPRTAARSV
jgi:hypothetical protein